MLESHNMSNSDFVNRLKIKKDESGIYHLYDDVSGIMVMCGTLSIAEYLYKKEQQKDHNKK